MHRYLVVANQTLGGDDLVDAIRDRIARGPAEFWVVVPATHTKHLIDHLGSLGAPQMGMTGRPVPGTNEVDAPDHGVTAAEYKLGIELDRLRAAGATADGAVGDADPLTAIQDAVARQRFDEIILSTLPAGISRWLNQDLPHKVERRVDVPLTVITATG